MPASVAAGRAQDGGATAALQHRGAYNPLLEVPLRSAPDEPDRWDSQRIQVFGSEYASQTNTLLTRDRQIEYNVRMLCGQQWNVWHPTLGRFFDIADWLSNDERAWRKLPVINKLLRWYVVTHSRVTENPPILTVLPGPDKLDAELAEVLDGLLKKDWNDAGMEAVHDELMMWMVIAGRAYAISRIDLSAGEWKPWIATAPVPIVDQQGLPVLGPDGQPAMSGPMPDVPLNADGSANAVVGPDGQMVPIGPPYMERSGGIAVDVYSPLQVRGQWGPQLWHKKQWHCVQRFLTPEQAYEMTGVEVEPDISTQEATNIATLERVLQGAGFYGASMGRQGSGWVDANVKGPLCTIYERWQAPIRHSDRLEGTWAEAMVEAPEMPGNPMTGEPGRPANAGGRHTVWSPKKLCSDGPREVAWPAVSPVRCFDFIRLPGRPSGTTPLEMLLGPQRAYNSSRAQVMEQAALSGNPQTVIDEAAGIEPGQMTNQPGKIYTAARVAGVPAVEYIVAPGVSSDVIKSIEFAAEEIDDLGGLRGTEGQPPTRDPSGELVKVLLFNADRLLGATARRNVGEYGRMADDWRAVYRIIYTAETVIAINGQDNLAQTITILPDLFKEGHVMIRPDAESMLPEGRGERQARAEVMWKDGVFGDPLSIEAREIYLEQARFPNYSRMAHPGGPDWEMARQENGEILMGKFDQPVLPWYDDVVHLNVHERYMKGPQFKKQPPIVQQAFNFHRLLHIQKLAEIMNTPVPGAQPPAPGGGGPAGAQGIPPETGDASQPGQGAPPKSVQAGGRGSPLAPSRPRS